MKSCQFVVLRSLRGRLGSVLDVGNRLPRMRGRSHRCIHISKVLCAPNLDHDPPKFWIQSSLKSPKHCRTRRKRLPDPRPIPEGVREPICIRKK